MIRSLYKFFFEKAGWKINGNIPSLNKYIIIVAPHSSNWDFLVGLAARSIIKMPAHYLAKKELFRFPFGLLFKALGGYPVDRSKNSNLVDSVAEMFQNKNPFIITMTPEGTRGYVEKWRTGFYYLSLKAKVPIVMISFDYSTKTVFVRPAFYPTGNYEIDFKNIVEFYFDKKGKNEKRWPEEFYRIMGK